MEKKYQKMKSDKDVIFSTVYKSSIFQDFESLLRTEVDFVEDDIRLDLDSYNSKFMSYELQPGVYCFKDVPGGLPKKFQLGFAGCNNSIDNEFNETSMKNIFFVKPDFFALMFDETSFHILGVKSHWD